MSNRRRVWAVVLLLVLVAGVGAWALAGWRRTRVEEPIAPLNPPTANNPGAGAATAPAVAPRAVAELEAELQKRFGLTAVGGGYRAKLDLAEGVFKFRLTLKTDGPHGTWHDTALRELAEALGVLRASTLPWTAVEFNGMATFTTAAGRPVSGRVMAGRFSRADLERPILPAELPGLSKPEMTRHADFR